MGHGSVHAKVMKASNRIVPLYPISVRHPVMGWDTIIRPREGTTNKEEFFLLVERMTHGRYNLKINYNNMCTHITWYLFIVLSNIYILQHIKKMIATVYSWT